MALPFYHAHGLETMSDKLAPLLERQGPWLISAHSTMEDTDIWAAYVKFTDESRALLRKWKKHVDKLKEESNLFYSLQLWNPVNVRFLDQGTAGKPDLEEFVAELVDGNTDQLLIIDRFVEPIEDLEALRTSCELVVITVDGVTWEACNKYSNTQYSTAQISWGDI